MKDKKNDAINRKDIVISKYYQKLETRERIKRIIKRGKVTLEGNKNWTNAPFLWKKKTATEGHSYRRFHTHVGKTTPYLAFHE